MPDESGGGGVPDEAMSLLLLGAVVLAVARGGAQDREYRIRATEAKV